MRHLHLIGYDIGAQHSRSRVLRLIRGNSMSGQKSVYECWLNDRELHAVRQEISAAIDQSCDKVLIIRLDPRSTIHALGAVNTPSDSNMFYQG